MTPLLRHPPPRPPPAATVEELSEEEGLERSVTVIGDEFDTFGFTIAPDGDALGDSAKAYSQWFQPKATRRLRRLEARKARLATPGDWSAMPKATLKALVRKGLPEELRPELWWSILGCEAQQLQSPVTYAQYLQEPLESAAAETIERDLTRTFPNNKLFRTAAGRGQLRNVLHAFARRRPSIQYCQGLNFIAGLLLAVFKNEEQSFWALVCAFDALGVEGYYIEGMTLLRADMQVLASFMKCKCPKVAKEMQRLGIDLSSICSEWYITWFAKSLPTLTVLRVWDTLFFEGFKVLFRVSIGVFKCVEQDVLKCGSFEAVMERAKSWPRFIVEHNQLLKASFGGLHSLRRQDLLKARDDALVIVEKEDMEHRRLAQARREASQACKKATTSTSQALGLSRSPDAVQSLHSKSATSCSL